jgi:hypothetical protein
MDVKAEIKVDGNRAMENKKSRPFVWIVGLTILGLFAIALVAGICFGANGKDVETTFLKIKTPIADSAFHKKDTVSIRVETNIDNSKKVVVPDNHGKMIIKM